MTSIVEIIPSTVRAIYDYYKESGDSDPQRGYLGASIIGHSCERYLWYTYRACCSPSKDGLRPFDGRMYRLFNTGQREEARVINDLRNIGCTVEAFDDQGQQFAVDFLGGHFSGHLDGAVLGIPEAPKTWHVLEIKTHNLKSFTKLTKEGVKKAKPQHYAQMQVYMRGTGMKRALYFAVCKDNDEIYTERVEYNKEEAEALLDRAKRIITNTTPPPRIADRPDYYECKWCDARDICWGCNKVLPILVKSCKQCCYATPITTFSDRAPDQSPNARWFCERNNESLGPGCCIEPCERHLCLPGLFPLDIVVEGTDGLITFKKSEDGKEWNHGGFDYSTDDLMRMKRDEL